MIIEPSGTIDAGTIAVVKYLFGFFNFTIISAITLTVIYWYKNR